MLTVSVSVVLQNVTRMRILIFLGRKYHNDQELVNYFDQGILDRKVLDHGIFVIEYKQALYNVDFMTRLQFVNIIKEPILCI